MPQIAQQDYIHLETDQVIEFDMELTDEQKRTLFRCARNGSLLDVVISSNFGDAETKSRIIFGEIGDDGLYFGFYSRVENAMVSQLITEPEPEPETEEE